MLTRIISAAVLIPIALVLVYLGGFLYLIGVLALSVLGALEMHKLLEKMGCQDMKTFLLSGAVLIPVLFCYQPAWLPNFFFLFVLSGLLINLSQYPEAGFKDLGINFLSVLYVSFGFGHFVLLRNMEQGMLLVAYALVVIWLTDAAAYFVGSAIGKRPFYRQISPKKSLEGAVGGLVFGALGAVLFCVVVSRFLPLENKTLLILLSPFLSAAGQAGDLFESSVKRQAGVKDSSKLIPGHGGILDRMDSALIVIPLLYHLLSLFKNIFA
ncbi:MAG: phosphatidate cytidylyltransferase [Peptococcaceae bacterium]|nr:phosphatidate cytidylyltransferase [Peptococcaceae bacterium]